MKSLGLTALISIAALAPASADQDVLLTAVSFALTGYDTAHVEIVDRANCVFMLNAKTQNGQLVGEVFHLNNVDIDRITITDWKDLSVTWIQIELHGETTVYEYTGIYDIDNNGISSADEQLKFQQISHPRQSSSWTLKIYSTERDRIIRAWQYIYANGCTGKKSPF